MQRSGLWILIIHFAKSRNPVMPRTHLLVVLGLVASVAYLAVSMRTGFIGHDEGTLAQSAERVLVGETPHIDFDDPFTGGLSYLNAATFHLLGARSSSLRVLLLLFSIAFAVAYFSAASHIVRPLMAVLLVFAAVAWGPKNYFTGLPSWYNLFFATFGTLALLRDASRARQRSSAPLFVAGLMGGASILIKISGVFFVLAALLYILYDAQAADENPPGGDSPQGTPRLANAFAWIAPPTTFAFLLFLTKHRLDPMDVLHFFVPGTLMALVPWLRMRQRPVGSECLADGPFLRRALSFAAGVACPLILFLAFYITQHGSAALTALFRGIFVLPQLRLGFASAPLPPLGSLLLATPFLLLFLPWVQERLRRPVAVAILLLIFSAVLTFSVSRPPVYAMVWSALRPLTPFLVVLAVLRLVRRDVPCEQSRRLYLLAVVVSFTSLIQYPYAFGIYFFYAAPLILLLAVEFFARFPAGRNVQLCLLGFFTCFAVLLLNGADARRLGVFYQPSNADAVLAPERINLFVPAIMKQGYELTAETVRSHTSRHDDLWAGPDIPEMYFLTGKHNPTRSFYDFFDPEAESNLLRLTAGNRIRLVVINRRPEFSPPLSPPTLALLTKRFPNALDIGPFQVRWRPEDTP